MIIDFSSFHLIVGRIRAGFCLRPEKGEKNKKWVWWEILDIGIFEGRRLIWTISDY